MKDTAKFNVVKASYEDGKAIVATAINNDEREKITKDRLLLILNLQRVTLLEKGDDESKAEADKLEQIVNDDKDAIVVFEVANETITREDYVKLYHADNVEELLAEYEWKVI